MPLAQTLRMEERLVNEGHWPVWLGWLIVNRFQIVYYILFLPHVLIYPYMIWIIPIAALLSHLNLRALSIWLQTREARLGHAGFTQLLGGGAVRLLAFLGIGVILMQSTIMTLSYLDILHQTLFPSMSKVTPLILLGLASFYLARLGMTSVGHFAILAFLMSIWMVLIYVQFLLPQKAVYEHLFPLIPQHVPPHILSNLLTVWAAFTGPEYLAFAGKRFAATTGLFRWLALGNAATALEYMFFFVITLLFYGAEYLQKIDLPVVQIVRYIELPFFERLEMVMVSNYMILIIFMNAFFIHYLYDAVRTVANFVHKPKSALGLTGAAMLLGSFMYFFSKYLWVLESEQNRWVTFHLWVSGATYAVIPSFLAFAGYLRNKRRADN